MLQLSQFVFKAPPEQALQVEWQVEQIVSEGVGKKLPSGHKAVQVLDADQKNLKLILEISHDKQSVLDPPEQVRHSPLHWEHILFAASDT